MLTASLVKYEQNLRTRFTRYIYIYIMCSEYTHTRTGCSSSKRSAVVFTLVCFYMYKYTHISNSIGFSVNFVRWKIDIPKNKPIWVRSSRKNTEFFSIRFFPLAFLHGVEMYQVISSLLEAACTMCSRVCILFRLFSHFLFHSIRLLRLIAVE